MPTTEAELRNYPPGMEVVDTIAMEQFLPDDRFLKTPIIPILEQTGRAIEFFTRRLPEQISVVADILGSTPAGMQAIHFAYNEYPPIDDNYSSKTQFQALGLYLARVAIIDQLTKSHPFKYVNSIDTHYPGTIITLTENHELVTLNSHIGQKLENECMTGRSFTRTPLFPTPLHTTASTDSCGAVSPLEIGRPFTVGNETITAPQVILHMDCMLFPSLYNWETIIRGIFPPMPDSFSAQDRLAS